MLASNTIMKMLISLSVLALAGACANSGNTYGDVEITEEAKQRGQRIFITDVIVTGTPVENDPDLGDLVHGAVSNRTGSCATGNQARTMEVKVTRYTGGNAAQAFLIGDEVELYAQIILRRPGQTDAASTHLVYEVLKAGGLLGAVAIGFSARSLSENLAGTICSEVFGASIEDDLSSPATS